MTSMGSTPLPSGLGHLSCPAASRIRPWMSTVWNGILLHMLAAGEDHARDPEEDDVVACDEHVRRIEVVQIRRLVRPAERGERPERARRTRCRARRSRDGCSWSGTPRTRQASRRGRRSYGRSRRSTTRGSDGPTRAGARCTSRATLSIQLMIRFGEAVRHELDLGRRRTTLDARPWRAAASSRTTGRIASGSTSLCRSGSTCRHCATHGSTWTRDSPRSSSSCTMALRAS